MQWDEMQVLALKPDNVGLRIECHDHDCKRAVWRDFWDFPPTLTLRELRAKVKCDTSGSLCGVALLRTQLWGRITLSSDDDFGASWEPR